MNTNALRLAALALALAGCPARPPVSRPAPAGRIVIPFTGVVDTASGTVRIATGADAVAAGFVEIPVVQDGVPGSGPPETVEFVTERAEVLPGGCGAVDGFEAAIRLRSFFTSASLANVFLEVTSITPTGREACNSAPAPAGLSAQYGLFAYGTIGKAGTPAASAVTTWRFRVPDMTNFAFRGRLVADLVVDALAPMVTSVSPRDGKTNVAAASAVVLTFSEPMYVPSTAAAISVEGPSGPVAGTVGSDGTRTSFTFTPSAPLPASSRFQVNVAGTACDAAGNPLPPFRSSFTTPAPVVQVSGPTQARYGNRALAFDGAGNGLAAWTANTLTGYRVMASFLPRGTTWGQPAVLVESGQQGPAGMATTAPLAVKVAAAGAGFLVAWSTGSDVKGFLVDGSGAAGTEFTLLSSVAGIENFDVAGSATGYAVVGSSGGDVSATVFDGSQWSTAAIEASPSVTATYPRVAWNGTTWIVAYRTSTAPYPASYSPLARSWTTGSAIPTLAGSVSDAPLAVAGQGGRTCVVFSEGDAVVASVATSGTAFGLAKQLSSVGPTGPTSLGVAASGAGFAAVWRATSVGTVNAYGRVYWVNWAGSAESLLESETGSVQDVRIVGVSSSSTPSYLLGLEILATGVPDVWAASAVGYSWSAPARVETGAAGASRPALAATGTDEGAISWDQDDGSGPQLYVRAASTTPTLGTAAALGGTPPEGSTKGLAVAGRGGGEVMAVWAQDERNDTAVYAALRTPAGFTAPVQVATRARAPAVASNGSTYLVAYQQWNVATQAWDVAAAEWNGTAFDAPVTLAAGGTAPAAASDGLGYAVAWTGANRLSFGTRIREAGSWGTARLVGSTGSPVQYPALGGKGGEYLAAYLDTLTWTMKAQRATRSAGAWTWSAAASIGNEFVYSSQAPAIAAGSGGWAVAYWKPGTSGNPDTAYGAVFDGTAWSWSYLESGSWCSVGNPPLAVAALGSGYLFTSGCSGSSLNAWAWTTSKGATVSTGVGAYSAVLSTDGVRYQTLATVHGWSPLTLRAFDWIGGAPQTTAVADTLAYPNGFWGDLALRWDGNANVAVWTRQPAGTPASDRVHARWSP